MNTLKELRQALWDARATASRAFEANERNDFDAGRYEGLKEAMELLDKYMGKLPQNNSTVPMPKVNPPQQEASRKGLTDGRYEVEGPSPDPNVIR